MSEKRGGGTVAIVLLLVIAAILGVIVWMSPDLLTSSEDARARADRSTAEAERALADLGIALDPPDAASPWSYERERDELSGRDVVSACTLSTNAIRLDWPYRSQQARLCIRQHPRWGEDVIFGLPYGGQIVCPVRNCILQIRIGAAEPSGFSVNEPQDRSNSAVFIANVRRFMSALADASEVAIEAHYYEAGAQTALFNTGNLEWPPAASDVAPGE